MLPVQTSDIDYIFKLSLSGNGDRQWLNMAATTHRANYEIRNSADDDATTADSVAGATLGTPFKVSMAYADDDANVSLDGETTVQDATVGIPLAVRPTQLLFGTGAFDSNVTEVKYVKTLKYWPLRLANSVLESEST
jgi:nitrous oxidase accessory protein NosD